VLHPNN